MEKDEWLNNIKKSAAKSKYMSLKDKNYVPTGVEKGFVIGDYTLVVKNPEAMQNYSRLTSAYRTFCCEEYNGLEVISNDIYERLHSGRKPDYQDMFSDIATNSVVFFPRNAEDPGIMPDDIITLTEADCTDVPPERMVASLLIEIMNADSEEAAV